MARAAASTSLTVGSIVAGLVGLMSTATRAAPGTISRRISNRFALSSPVNRLMPVRLPPGRARLATRPYLTGSSGGQEYDGDRRGYRLDRQRRDTVRRHDHGDLSANQVGCQLWQPIHLIFGPAVFDRHVLALNIADILQALTKSAQTLGESVRRCVIEEPNYRHRRLLRARRERPCRSRAAKQRDDLAPVQPIEMHLRPQPTMGDSIPHRCRLVRGWLQCRILVWLMSALGQTRPIDEPATLVPCPLRSKSGQVNACLDLSALCQKPTFAVQQTSPCQSTRHSPNGRYGTSTRQRIGLTPPGC